MRFFKGIYYIFLTALILLALLLIVSVFPIPGNFKIMAVLSGSMEPKIHTGSVVAVKPASSYKIGDIITFGAAGQTPTTHRIAEIKDGGYITKGDANNANDSRVIYGRDIIGKVYLSVPYAGYAVNVVKKPVGFIVIVVIPAVIIIYEEFKKIIREAAKMRKKRQELNMPEKLMPTGGTKEPKQPE